MRRNGKGIYFHSETREVLRVAEGGPNSGEGWIRISEDDTLGLLAVRRLVEERKLVDDVTTVEWSGMRRGTPSWAEEMSALIRQFKRDSEESREEAQSGLGLLARLGARLRFIVGGSSSDDGHSPPLALATIAVRSRDTDDRHPSSR